MYGVRNVERTRTRCHGTGLLALAFLPLAICSHAAGPAPALSLVTGPDYAPYTDSNAPGGGLAVEIVGRAFAAAAIPYTVSWRPWKRGYAEARMGMYDAAFPYAFSTERAQSFHFSAPLAQLEIQLFTRPGSTLNAANPASLAGKRICTPLGWATALPVIALVEQGSVKEERPPTLAHCAAMVALGRADFFISERRIGSAAAATAGEAAVVMGGRYASSALYLIAPKSLDGSAELINAFNRGLARIQRSGEYARILARHDGAAEPRVPQ